MYNHQYQQAQYYSQLYGASSSSIGAPYYYAPAPGYSLQAAAAAARGNFPVAPAQRFQAPSYLYYPTQTTPMEGSAGSYPASPHPLTQPPRLSFPTSTGNIFPMSALFAKIVLIC